MTLTVKVYKDQQLIKESRHHKVKTAYAAFEKTDGDIACLSTDRQTIWYHRKGDSWTRKYEIYS